MRRSMLAVMAVVALAACQSAPRPSQIARPSSIASASSVSTPKPTALPTPVPTSPFIGEYFEEAVVYGAIDRFVAALETLYRKPDQRAIDATFTAGGLRAALAYDWRLREAMTDEALFIGDLSVRGRSIISELPAASPPSFDVDLSLAIDPGSELIDPSSRSVVQRWDERQLFNLRVAFAYQVGSDRWQVALVGPAEPGFANAPPSLPPPVRCPGLGPDRWDGADLVEGRTWCIGGEDGMQATRDQVIVHDRYPCGTSRASIFNVGWPVGSAIDGWDDHYFIRDPDGRFRRENRLPIPYIADGRMPKDAYSTGLTDGEFEIWVSPKSGAKGLWVTHGDRIERWPRVDDPWLVIDCN